MMASAEAADSRIGVNDRHVPGEYGTKCPNCGSLAHNIGPSSQTLMAPVAFTDDEGRLHYHDPNTVTVEYTCRKCGRAWGESYRPKCRYGDD